MMKCCAQYEDALWDAAESGHLPEALQRHCADCPPCRDAAREIQQMLHGFAALQTLEHPAPRPDIRLYLPRHGFLPRFAWRMAATAACLALLVALVLPLLRSQPRVARGPVSPSPSLPAPQPRERYIVTPAPPAVTPAPAPAPPARTVIFHKALRHRHPRIAAPTRTPPVVDRGLTIQPTAPQPASPEMVPIMGTVAKLPANVTTLDADRIQRLVDTPAVCNQVYTTMETVGNGQDTECQKIYEKPAGG